MHVHRIVFALDPSSPRDDDAIADAISAVLAAWRMNGQICGREWPIVAQADGYSILALTPESDSLDPGFDGRHVSQALARAKEAALTASWRSLGEDPMSASVCDCASPSAYVLFTTWVSLESPVRCLDCFQPVALYRFQPTRNDEYCDVIGWQSDYQSCDSLQMNCSVLERAATREMSNAAGNLSSQGREICDTLAGSSGRPFYYYLYRSGGRSDRAELARRCPACGGEWALPARQHMFDFRCDRCHLLSNVSFSQR
jgi:predicted  nucleic acid-binding Zn ribbon protein